MRSDRDIERELAGWLERTTRPLADDVLQQSVHAALATGQVKAGRRHGGFIALRVTTAVAIAAVVVLAVIAAPNVPEWLRGLGLRAPVGSDASGTPSPEMEWDAMMSFRELNPAPDGYGHRFVYSWLRSSGLDHDPSTYVPLPDYEETDDIVRWFDPEYDAPENGDLYIGVPKGDDHIQLHPWGGGNDIRASIIAWRNPDDASLVMSGSVEVDGTCGDGVIFSIEHGPDVLREVTVRSGRQTFELAVDAFPAGEALYFIFEPGANSDCDTTRFNVMIRTR